MDLPTNARVDALGRSHEGKIIYRVIVNGGEPMYLVDASTDTVDENGKAIFGAVKETETTLKGPALQQHAHEQWYQTIVVPFDPEAPVPEPPLRGSMVNGLNKAWIDWYRVQGKGCGLIEASEEGLRRLADHKSVEWANAPEPSLSPRFPGSNLPSQEWVTWYRRKTGATISEAVAEGQRRISQLSSK